MRLGVAGLPMTGKSTIMAGASAWALLATAGSKGPAQAGRGTSAGLAVARIPDPRVDWLAELYHPRKVTHATVEWVELADLSPSHIEAVHKLDAVVLVVRAFDPGQARVPHPEGDVDPLRDFERLWQDWILLDWGQVQGRLERLKSAPSVPKAQRRDVEQEVAILTRCLAALEEGIPLRRAGLAPEDQALLRGYSLVTFRPAIAAINVDDDQMSAGDYGYPGKEGLERALRGKVDAVVPVAARLDLELAQLDAPSREAFIRDLGLSVPVGVERLGAAAYDACGFISFLTGGEDEVRAWTIARGTVARDAAAKIHSDIARGFIRAEVVAFEDLERLGSIAAAREAGLLRLEGKEYVVRDGDVIEFRFNV